MTARAEKAAGITVRAFGPRAEAEFDAITKGAEECYGDAYRTREAKALYAALGLPTTSEEERLYRLADGRLALIGCTVEGHDYAIGAAEPKRGPGADFRARRRALKLTQEQVAALSGVTTSAVARLERGETAPQKSTLAAIELALYREEHREHWAPCGPQPGLAMVTPPRWSGQPLSYSYGTDGRLTYRCIRHGDGSEEWSSRPWEPGDTRVGLFQRPR